MPTQDTVLSYFGTGVGIWQVRLSDGIVVSAVSWEHGKMPVIV